MNQILTIWISRGRLQKFVENFLKKIQEETMEEIYLHRIHNKSYVQWREEVMGNG